MGKGERPVYIDDPIEYARIAKGSRKEQDANLPYIPRYIFKAKPGTEPVKTISFPGIEGQMRQPSRINEQDIQSMNPQSDISSQMQQKLKSLNEPNKPTQPKEPSAIAKKVWDYLESGVAAKDSLERIKSGDKQDREEFLNELDERHEDPNDDVSNIPRAHLDEFRNHIMSLGYE